MMADDPGLAAERTQLAWRRSGLSVGVAAATTVRVMTDGSAGQVRVLLEPGHAASLVLIAVAATLFLVGMVRSPGLPPQGHAPSRPVVRRSQLRGPTWATVLLAAAASVQVIMLP